MLGGLEEDLFPSFMSKDTPDGLDEERRLFYVAITRAEEFLTLAFATNRYRHGQMKQYEPSRFLDEIPIESTDALGGLKAVRRDASAPQTARVSGNFSRPIAPQLNINSADFKAAKPEEIEIGNKVLHLKFGEGKVVAIEGAKDNRIATIHFAALTDQPQRKIMLKFAKLQIL